MTPEPTNPFDLDALRSAPLSDLDLERVLTTVPVRKPSRTEFIRVHPSPDYVVDSYVLEHVSGLDRVVYWVAPGLRGELVAELRPVRLFTCITKWSTEFLWPAKLPLAEGDRKSTRLNSSHVRI